MEGLDVAKFVVNWFQRFLLVVVDGNVDFTLSRKFIQVIYNKYLFYFIFIAFFSGVLVLFTILIFYEIFWEIVAKIHHNANVSLNNAKMKLRGRFFNPTFFKEKMATFFLLAVISLF